ncbi:hypothetical protein PINS_up018209 [Pythium insidiosum]|nr:hypothetical protein PINS_up018209 [Pythium insidiosum]
MLRLLCSEPVGRPHEFDVELLGYSDEILEELCRLLGWEIPTPDPILLSQLNLSPERRSALTARRPQPLEFDFIPPSRHMFSGALSSCPSSPASSSSEDEDVEPVPSFSQSDQGSERTFDVGMGGDDDDDDAVGPRRSRHGPRNRNVSDDEDEDHDHLMGSGSELLRNSTFDDDMGTEDGDM